jgi:hypothetical protein
MSENPLNGHSLGPGGNEPVDKTENEDISLAKILQQQERAFLELRGETEVGLSSSFPENLPPPGMTEDEELAWRLMREEESMFQQRMLAMAGIARPTDSATDEFGLNPGPFQQEHQSDEPEASIDPDELTYEELTNLGDIAGTVACGLSEEQFRQLPHSRHGDAPNHNGDPCIICQIDFDPEDLVTHLPCSHVFHDECLRPWLSKKKTCPFCSTELKVPVNCLKREFT